MKLLLWGHMMCNTRKQTLRSLSLSYQRRMGARCHIIYDVSRVKFWKVGVIPKEGLARPCVPILFFGTTTTKTLRSVFSWQASHISWSLPLFNFTAYGSEPLLFMHWNSLHLGQLSDTAVRLRWKQVSRFQADMCLALISHTTNTFSNSNHCTYFNLVHCTVNTGGEFGLIKMYQSWSMLINVNRLNSINIDEILWHSPDEHFGVTSINLGLTLINIDQLWINID